MLAREPRLPAHVLIESYSVLTRLPAPHRAGPGVVEAFLAERFPAKLLILPQPAYRVLLKTAAASGVSGGAIYDALVAITVKHAGAVLLTRERRAAAIYDSIGVRYELT